MTLSRPAPGRDPQYLTPTASVRIDATAEDPLYGARRLFLEYRVGRDGPVRTIPLGSAEVGATSALAGVGGGLAFALAPPSGTIETVTRVPIATFTRDDGTPVREGDLLVLRAAADDFDDVAPLKGWGAAPSRSRFASPRRKRSTRGFRKSWRRSGPSWSAFGSSSATRGRRSPR